MQRIEKKCVRKDINLTFEPSVKKTKILRAPMHLNQPTSLSNKQLLEQEP